MKQSIAFPLALALFLPAFTRAAEPSDSQTSGKCCEKGNLAFGRLTTASSEESNKKNFAHNAVDGDLQSRWCAANAGNEHSWQVDLGQTEHVKSLRIRWEADSAYRYRIEASSDAKAWKTIVDQSNNKRVARITSHEVDAPDARYLRLTYFGSSTHHWGSIREFEAYPGKLPPLPKDDSALGPTVVDVQAPDGFDVTMFGSPPRVNYPVCLTAASTGEVFVGVDEQGSLGKQTGRGKILRLIDTDGDGQADKINEFTKIDHPRGLVYDNGSLWVLHPPLFSVCHDDDLDGVADRRETLITGISTEDVGRRGADHTTNGIRMGIDGWIYIAVGDYGFTEAKGTDGTVLSRRGGGIVRVRPDGTEMEIYSWGLRNILDVCIDPFLNIFTRDNTNDGGGWDVRLSHGLQSALYGYPSLYQNFSDEIMPPLADYGGGSGCGGMFFHDLRWPDKFSSAVFTCDWGRSEVYRHNLPANGPTFDAHQEVFLKIPRPTDIDVDGSGLMYVSSWKNGEFNYSDANVGFVVQIKPTGFTPKPFPDLQAASDEQLVGYLASPSAVYRLHSQLQILRRGRHAARTKLLASLSADDKIPLYGRVAAIFTLKQLDGPDSQATLLKLAKDPSVCEFAMRALTDRKSQLDGISTEPFISALQDSAPRVRAQALISLGRLGVANSGEAILPLTRRLSLEDTSIKHNQPDPDRVLPHLAVRSLVAIGAWETCVKALDGPDADGAFWALKYMHNAEAIDGLIEKLNRTRDLAKRRAILAALIRLYHREGDYTGGWWGTRPDQSGPYYDRKPWEESPRIAATIQTAVSEADADTVRFVSRQLARHKVQIEGLPSATQIAAQQHEVQAPIVLPKIDENDPNLIANLSYEEAAVRALATKGDPEKGQQLFVRQSCIACHTYADGQLPKGPHLVDIGRRYQPAELVESILKPSEKIAQGFDTYTFETSDGKLISGFVVSESADTVTIREADGMARELTQDDIEERVKQKLSMMPVGLANNLTPEQMVDLLAYLQSLRSN